MAAPLLEGLLKSCGGRQHTERRLLALLDSWRNGGGDASSSEQGYAPGSVVNLLRLLRGDLRGVNLARLALRQAYLQGVEAQDSSLAYSRVRDPVLPRPLA